MESEKQIYCNDGFIVSMIAKHNNQKRWDIYGISEVLGMGNAEYNKKLFTFDFTDLIPLNSYTGTSYVCLKKENKWGLLELKGNDTVECEWKIIVDFTYYDKDNMLADLKKSKIQKITNKVVTNIRLSKGNRKFIDYINSPLDFGHSTPGKYVEKATKNGETMFQREIYKSNDEWFDIELPIGQVLNPNSKRWSNKARIDLIGRLDGVLTLCELKKTKKPENAFDATLQLLAYYVMLLNNAVKLDNSNVHHTNSHNSSFKWVDFCNEKVILIVMANDKYWENLPKLTTKNNALKKLISLLLNEDIAIILREATEEQSKTFIYEDLKL